MATALKHKDRSRVSKHSEDMGKRYFFGHCTAYTLVIGEQKKKMRERSK